MKITTVRLLFQVDIEDVGDRLGLGVTGVWGYGQVSNTHHIRPDLLSVDDGLEHVAGIFLLFFFIIIFY